MLRTKVKRRMKRIAKEAMSDGARRALFKEHLTVKGLLEHTRYLKAVASDETKWATVRGKIDDFAPDLVKLKHTIEGGCRGGVFMNKCWECNAITEGVKAFSFSLKIRDIDDEGTMVRLTASNTAGEAIFGMNAATFDGLDQTVQGDIIEKKTETTVVLSLSLKYDKMKDSMWVNAYNAAEA